LASQRPETEAAQERKIYTGFVCLVTSPLFWHTRRKLKKQQTYEQVEARKDKGARFLRDVLDDDDRADDIEDESVEDYAERKGITITNLGRRANMANGNGGNDMTKSELEDCIDQVTEILQAAYTPEATREEMAAAIGDALDALSGEDTGDENDDGSDGDDDGQ
jgi:hypothetical protein